MGVLWKTAAWIISVYFLCAGFSSAASTTAGFQNCGQYYYYDHGTNHCEHCRDICDKASHQDTVEQCLDLCGPYAQMIENQKRKPPDSPTPQPPNNNDNKSDNTTSGFPPGAWIGVIAVGLVCTLVSGVFLLKRRVIMSKIRRNNGSSTIPNQTAVYIPQSDPSQPPPALPANGSVAGTSGSGTATQEEGEPCGEGAGYHSYHILPPGIPESTPLLKLEPSTPTPVPVSPEGQDGGHDMALPSNSHDHSYPGSGLFLPSSDNHPLTYLYGLRQTDLESTEPKTLQPSLESIQCLLPGADGDMRTTTI